MTTTKRRPPRLEPLEDRRVPAVAVWITRGEGSWFDASNWRNGRVPTSRDDVSITVPGAIVRFAPNAANAEPLAVNVRSLTCTRKLVITHGVLSSNSATLIDDLDLRGGTLDAGPSLNLTGDVLWTAGTLSADSTIDFRGSVVARGLPGGLEVKMLDAPTVNNYGFWSWREGRILDRPDSVFVNQSGAVCRFEGGRNFDLAGVNRGLWVIESPTAITMPSFDNEGDLTLRVGQLRLMDNFAQTDGSITLAGGGLYSQNVATLDGGVLLGGGTIDGSLVNNGARIAPGGTRLTILGDFTQGDEGILEITLAGPAPAGRFDRITVTGTATLAGSLDVVVLQPSLGANNRYAVFEAGRVVGRFDSLTPAVVPGFTLLQAATASSVAVVAFVRVEPTRTDENSQIVNGNDLDPDVLPTPADVTGPPVNGADVTRSLLNNAGLVGTALSGGNGRPVEVIAVSGGELVTGPNIPTPAGGERAAVARLPESSGSDELAQALVPPPPVEFELPPEEDGTTPRDLVQEQLMARRGRMTLLSQGGAQGAVIATSIPGGDPDLQYIAEARSPASRLFIDPLTQRSSPDDAPAALVAEPPPPPADEELSTIDAAFLALAALGALAAGRQRKLCSAPGNEPSLTSRQ